jgi:hypothetical protein
MLSSEAANRFDPTLGENANHYTTDAVCGHEGML